MVLTITLLILIFIFFRSLSLRLIDISDNRVLNKLILISILIILVILIFLFFFWLDCSFLNTWSQLALFLRVARNFFLLLYEQPFLLVLPINPGHVLDYLAVFE